MTIQTSILDEIQAVKARDNGMKRASDHADQVHSDWSSKAYSFLISFRQLRTKPFMVEDVRDIAEGVLPEPPSHRAWGAVILRAAKAGIVEKVGYANTKNVKAHSTPATVWRFKN